jgi:hypothetical protein
MKSDINRWRHKPSGMIYDYHGYTRDIDGNPYIVMVMLGGTIAHIKPFDLNSDWEKISELYIKNRSQYECNSYKSDLRNFHH